MQAKLAKDVTENFHDGGKASLYEMTPPYGGESFVILLSTRMTFGRGWSRVDVYSSNAEGKVTDWEELKSIEGTLDHETVLNELGYTLLQ